MDLFSPVTALAGIGAQRAKQLEKLNIRTLYDLLAYFPRAYEDRTVFCSIGALAFGKPACFEAMVVSEPRTAHVRKGMDITRVQVADGTGKLTLTFFNQSYVKDSLCYGESYRFYGTLSDGYAGQMANPAFEPAEHAGFVTGRILPIYTLTAGISNKLLLKCVQQALAACADALPEILPDDVLRRYHLCPARLAYETVHQPASWELLAEARRRLVFEEFFIFSAGLAVMRGRRSKAAAQPYTCSQMDAFYAALGFPLTGAQRSAIDEILHDLASGAVMNRLVQGDVGSGKTVVAAAAVYCCVKNGHQAAFMAPTEILAEQHANTLSALLGPLGIDVILLTGSLGAQAKREAKERLADGHAQLAVGTHALLTADVTFSDLGLVVADEQHRFGVAQRAQLAAKARTPHLLVMSATPIPRTLALIAYGDLDVSVISELPPGRQKIDTFLVGEQMRRRVNAFIRRECQAGHQAYIVCPAVEEGETDTLKSASVWAGTLQQAVFPELRVGLLHGRMKGPEKQAALAAFARHETDILVATTVVEVGVDVPNATLMVIENAERFGLSQLHQLRGRVGRGSAKSYCILFSDAKNADTRARLKALCATNDGFAIAEQDLSLRGPGDFFGSRQHGLPSFKVASLQMDLATLQQAQQAAAAYIQSADDLDAPQLAPLRKRIDALFSQSDVVLN